MRRISSINNFEENLILESIVNESILYFSPILRANLEYIDKLHDSDIAKSLLSIEGENVKTDVTFVDLGQSGFLTFMQMSPAMKLIRNIYGDGSNNTDLDDNYNRNTSDILYNDDLAGQRSTGIFKKGRNQIRVGKFVKKMLGEKYTTQQIEEFVNSLKSLQQVDTTISVVSGKDIEFWYNHENSLTSVGTLGSSCMKDMKDVFGLYTDNPESCRMVIMTRLDKLVARALLWKLNSPILGGAEYFMDRIYYSSDHQVDQMREYAIKNGWSYRSTNSYGELDSVRYKGSVHYGVKMEVKLKNVDYKRYPYLDTFRRYVPKTGILYNDSNTSAIGYILNQTDGGFYRTYVRQTRISRFLDFFR